MLKRGVLKGKTLWFPFQRSSMLKIMDQEIISGLEERLRIAMLNSNLEELDALLATNLMFVTFLGERIGKDQDIAAHRSGFLQMHSIDISEREIVSLVDTAVVSCLARIDASFDGDRTCEDFRFTRVWAKTDSQSPQVVAGQATLVYASL